MLDHLHIENYRLFKSLQLDGLQRVNLITGKNNTGKTAILEAIRILKSDGENDVLNHILTKRDAIESNISFGEIFQSLTNDKKKLAFRINNSIIQYDSNKDDFPPTFGIAELMTSDVIKIDRINRVEQTRFDKVIYVPTSLDFDNTYLWKKIDLSPRKKDVIKILNVIEKKIIDVGLDIENRKPKVLLSDEENPLPLRMLGEGTNRIFTIALALVNARNNILLIDEIDLGLHHSVQEKLWEIVFRFSKELNVQVFATTHSQDCVQAFGEIWNKSENQKEGNYIRLQRNRLDSAIIEPVYYDANVLLGSIYDNLEIR